MLIKATRSPAATENPTFAIHRLLGLLETVVDQQAHLIEEIADPEAALSQKSATRVISAPPEK
jgi:DNA-binding transcriptional regulator YdaS (Cro superfamily)